jgi:hypothetical protein
MMVTSLLEDEGVEGEGRRRGATDQSAEVVQQTVERLGRER